MADSYSKWVMTTAFANNSQAALNSGGKIEWVSLKTSDDAHQVADLDGFNDTTLATANIKQISGISSVTISGNTVTITGLFNSTNNASDYYIRTIFLVAKYNGKEFLAGTTVANTSGSAFRMPASSDTEITEFTARPQISVTNTNSISTTVDPIASATNERVDSLEATLQGEIDDINVDKQNLWNKLADYVTKAAAETITGVKTFSQTIVGSITGNAGTATKLQTERTIGFSGDVNGTAQGFDGSKNITLPINLNSINQNNTTSTQSAGYNSPVTIIDDINRDTKGRVTGVNTKTVTLPPVQTTISGNAASATKLETARLIGGVSFDGTSDIILPGVNSIGNQNTTGNAATATNANLATKAVALQTPRKINGVGFDGTSDINVPASNDANLVHRTSDEIIDGNKNFTQPIDARIKERGTLTGNIDVLQMVKKAYLNSGVWKLNGVTIYGSGQDVANNIWGIMQIIPIGDGTGAEILIIASSGFGSVTAQLIGSGDGSSTSINWRRISDDATVMHLSGDEVVNGSKNFKNTATFEKPINGSFSISQALFTDFADVAKNMNTYSGKWFVSADQTILNSPLKNSVYLVEVIPANATVSGKIILTPYDALWDGSIYYSIVNWKGLSEWRKIAQDSQVLHLSGDETASGFKKFSGNIATTSDNSMINGGGNNGDIALVKKNGNSGFLGIGSMQLGGAFRIKQSNNASISPSDTFTDMFTVDVNGVVKAGLQQDLVPLDKNVVHNTGNETIGGDKNFTGSASFTQLINGALNSTRLVPFTDFYDVANGNMIKYAGLWFNQIKDIQHTPIGGDAYWTSIEVIPTSSSSGYIKVAYQITGDVYITGVDNYAIKGWYKIANDSNLVHKDNNETLTGNKNFSGVATFAKAQTSSTITKTITTSLPTTLQFTETAFGVMVYASGYGQFRTDGQWKTLATLPSGITPPTQVVIMSDVDWAGVGGVTYRLGVGLKISIKPTGEITYKCASLKDNDNTTYDVQTGFDLSTYWSK